MLLKAKQDDSIIVKKLLLNELSFHEFAEIVPSPTEWYSRYAKIWSFILWLQLIDMFRKDPESPSRSDPTFQQGIAALRSTRLLPAHDLSDSVREYASHPFNVPGLSDVNDSESPGRMLALTRLVEQLRGLARSYQSGKRFILFIDGTDEIFSGEKVLYESLAALIEAASTLNESLQLMDVDAKVVVLCRTDLFNRLPGSNKNKMKRDSGLVLNWYEDAKDLHHSALAKLANVKARVADPTIKDIFTDYLPNRMSRGGSDRRTIALLLDYTRHTPRDLLQLLGCIADMARVSPERSRDIRVTAETVGRGIAKYSRDYFAGEIEDEVWGHLGLDERAAIIPILTALGRERFTPEEFSQLCEKSFPDLNPGRLLGVLYECSALGHVRDVDSSSGKRRVTFKYRNPDSTLNLSEDLLLHNGWRTKLNIVEPQASTSGRNAEGARSTATTGRATRSPRQRRRTRQGMPLISDSNDASVGREPKRSHQTRDAAKRERGFDDESD